MNIMNANRSYLHWGYSSVVEHLTAEVTYIGHGISQEAKEGNVNPELNVDAKEGEKVLGTKNLGLLALLSKSHLHNDFHVMGVGGGHGGISNHN